MKLIRPLKYWKIDDECTEYAVSVKALNSVCHPFEAFVKWDGCANILFDKKHEAYIHICNLREHIESMQELIDIADSYFQEGYAK